MEDIEELHSDCDVRLVNKLQGNPFYVLAVSPEDSLERLTDRYEDVVDDHLLDERDALQHYQLLSSSLPRLEAEVAWLPGVPFTQALEAVRGGTLPDQPEWPSLAMANFRVAEAAAGNGVTVAVLKMLLTQWHAVRLDEVTESISRQRELSGFPQVESEQLKDALECHAQEQGRSVFGALIRAEDGQLPVMLAEALEGIEDSVSSSRFARELMMAYQRWCEGPIKTLGDEINASIQEMNTLLDSVLEPEAETDTETDIEIGNGIESEAFHAPAETLLECLNRWEVLSRPLRLESQRTGVDERHSMMVISATLDVAIRTHTFAPESATELAAMAHELTLGVPGMANRSELILGMLHDIADLDYLEEHAPEFSRWVESLGTDKEQLEATIDQHRQRHPEPSVEHSLFPRLVELLESAPDSALVRGAWIRCQSVLQEMRSVALLVHTTRHLMEIERRYPLNGSLGERLRLQWREMLWLEVQAGIEFSHYLHNQQSLTEWLQKGRERFGDDPDKLRFLDAQKTTIEPPSDEGIASFIVWIVIAIVFFLFLFSL